MNKLSECEKFVGETVRVVICPDAWSRNKFEPQMTITGTLEKRSADNQFRVLTDDGNYCYFFVEQVVYVMPRYLTIEYPTCNTIAIAIDVARPEEKDDSEYSAENILNTKEFSNILIPRLREKMKSI
jgi:hypothetical protein